MAEGERAIGVRSQESGTRPGVREQGSVGRSQEAEGDEMAVQNVKELTVYKKAFRQAMMTSLNHEVGKMLGSMISNPERFLLTTDA
jgi:hypothetical protein